MAHVTDRQIDFVRQSHGLDRVEAFHLCQQRAKAVANMAARRREASRFASIGYGEAIAVFRGVGR